MLNENLTASNYYISLVLGHSMLYESKIENSPNGIVDDARNGGDPPAPSTQESTASVMDALVKNLPSLINIMSENYAPLERLGQTTREEIAPREAALNAELTKKYLPVYSQASSDAEKQALLSNGPDIVHAADKLAREVDQPFYDTRDLGALKLGQLLGGQDPNKLTGGEETNVERGLNRLRVGQGENVNPSNTGTIKAALTFGGALDAKRANLAKAIDSATSFLGASRTGVDTFAQATGRSGTQNFGSNLFQGQGTGNQAFSQGQNAFNQITGLRTQENQINADRRDSLDRATQVLSSLPSISG